MAFGDDITNTREKRQCPRTPEPFRSPSCFKKKRPSPSSKVLADASIESSLDSCASRFEAPEPIAEPSSFTLTDEERAEFVEIFESGDMMGLLLGDEGTQLADPASPMALPESEPEPGAFQWAAPIMSPSWPTASPFPGSQGAVEGADPPSPAEEDFRVAEANRIIDANLASDDNLSIYFVVGDLLSSPPPPAVSDGGNRNPGEASVSPPIPYSEAHLTSLPLLPRSRPASSDPRSRTRNDGGNRRLLEAKAKLPTVLPTPPLSEPLESELLYLASGKDVESAFPNRVHDIIVELCKLYPPEAVVPLVIAPLADPTKRENDPVDKEYDMAYRECRAEGLLEPRLFFIPYVWGLNPDVRTTKNFSAASSILHALTRHFYSRALAKLQEAPTAMLKEENNAGGNLRRKLSGGNLVGLAFNYHPTKRIFYINRTHGGGLSAVQVFGIPGKDKIRTKGRSSFSPDTVVRGKSASLAEDPCRPGVFHLFPEGQGSTPAEITTFRKAPKKPKRARSIR
jgi:hypothetical protein